jgi:hypothetical protein
LTSPGFVPALVLKARATIFAALNSIV